MHPRGIVDSVLVGVVVEQFGSCGWETLVADQTGHFGQAPRRSVYLRLTVSAILKHLASLMLS